jgi:PAS domain S-box-containing protein
MSEPKDSRPTDAPTPEQLRAWLAQSRDLVALTDALGTLRWANPAFTAATGLAVEDDLLALAPMDWHEGGPRRDLQSALADGCASDAQIPLRSAAGKMLWVQARTARIDGDTLWTFDDVTALHELSASTQHQSELLDMAQEFGRLGIWEREIPSGRGRWDRHVFGFWGMEPTTGTPDYEVASSRIHPEDRTTSYNDSTLKAGRYSRRYRVLQMDGSVRWIHSQWEVKNSPQGRPDRAIGIMVDDTAVYELASSLDKTAAQLKLAAEIADIVIWRHDLKTGRIIYNEHGFKVLGVPFRPEGLTVDEARTYTHPDDVHKLAESAALALATDKPVDIETRHRWRDGTWRYMLVRRVVERSRTGEPLGFVGVSLDVTQQVEPARRAELLAARLETAAEAARIGIWTTTLGTDQTEWNAQMYELFDRADRSCPPSFGGWLRDCVHTDDRARVHAAIRAYLDSEHGPFEIEFRVQMRDGRVRWMVLRADLDQTGSEGARLFGIAMDVTDRHQALTALHAASERSALIASYAGIGTWETDEEGLPALWDAQMFRLRGLEPRPVALSREERLSLVHPDDYERVLDAIPTLNSSARSTAYEFRVRLPDGSYRWLASRSAAVLDPNGKITRRVGVNWDVTEAKSAENARQQALLAERESKAKSQFLSRMSHELRTPLNAVLGFTQLLQLELQQSPNPEQSAKLEYIRSAGEHLLTLINDTLDLSSLEAGTLRLDLQPVAIADAVARARPLVDELAAAHGISLQTGALEGTALADPTRLHQVLLNLLTNAIKYNRPGGHVAIDASRHEGSVRIVIRDNGRGLRADQLAHLFEPFNRLGIDSETAAGQAIEGTGIGLTIVKALVEGMGGAIAVQSVAGRGSSFEVTLPAPDARSLQAGSGSSSTAPVASAPYRHRSGQLLYIEDNSVNVLLVEELVKSLSGLLIVSESTGATGVARAQKLLPDMILVDMQLPDFDGFEVLRRLRAHPATASIPCIALSANAMPEDIARGLGAGFDDYWTKPIKFKPFLDALERLFPASDEFRASPVRAA